MLLAIDIGNTCIDIGLLAGDEIVCLHKFPTAPPADAGLQRLLAALATPPIGAVIGSVVAKLGTAYAAACRDFSSGPVLQAHNTWDWGLQIDYDDPARIGVDRLAAAAAAYRAAPAGQAVMVVDAGTALTVDAIDAEGTFRGGVITPGLRLGLNALSANTSFLPQVELAATTPLLGKNTADGLRSGALHGSAALVEGLCTRMAAALDTPVAIFLTGGDGPLLHPHIAAVHMCAPDLVLRGLALAYERRTA
ncbi:MAG: type III pantothenate kinase [Gemmatimonadetes bacterium]|nr:type III pantothenate kinase [Gemmatimonadota bacterium]